MSVKEETENTALARLRDVMRRLNDDEKQKLSYFVEGVYMRDRLTSADNRNAPSE